MKRIISSIVLTLILFLLSTGLVLALENFKSAEVVTLVKTETINKDFFAAGERVIISGTVNGDVYVAAGDVLVDGVINGDLLVAGGTVSIRGSIRDVRAVGGKVDLSGIAQNIAVVGGSILVNDSAKVSGSLTGAGGTIEIFAPIPKGVNAAAGKLTLANDIGSDVVAAVETLDLTSQAKINGDLTYYSDEQANFQPEATVSGKVAFKSLPKSSVDTQKVFQDSVWVKIIGTLSALLIGWAFVTFLPKITEKTVIIVREKTWQSLGLGFIFLFAVPVLIFLLFISIVAIPVGILAIILYILALMFAKVFVAIYLGEKSFDYAGKKSSLLVRLIVGLTILALVSLIPVVGWFVEFVTMLIGWGAFVLAKKEVYQDLRKKNFI